MKGVGLLKKVLIVAFIVSLIGASFFSYKIFSSWMQVSSVAGEVVSGRVSDPEKAVALMEFVWGLEYTEIKTIDYSDYLNMGFGKLFWTVFYSIPPKNIIPPDVVLDYGLVYSGPCGAKSKLLCSMLKSQGMPCRLVNLKDHTLVEAEVDGVWTLLDPTFDVYFTNPDGTLAPSEKVFDNPEFIEESATRTGREYPNGNPDFQLTNPRRIDLLLYMEPYYLLSLTGWASTVGLYFLYSRVKR